MRILLEREVPDRPDDWLLREAQPGQFFALLVYLAILCGAVVFAIAAWREDAIAFAVAAGLLALLFLFIARLQLGVCRASLGPGNWQLRASADGLYVKYRSYLNHELPANEPSVLFLAKREIAWVAEHRVSAWLPTAKGRDRQRHVTCALAIGLRQADTAAIAEALAAERRLWAETGKRGRRRFGDYPVRLQGEELHVRLREPGRALKRLGQRHLLRKAIEHDRGAISRAPRAAQESMLLELAESGRRFDAVTLARELYGYGLKDAKQFVEQLAGRR
jgi:hypothetical protein